MILLTIQKNLKRSIQKKKKTLIKLKDKLNNSLRSLKTKSNISDAFYNSCYSSGSQVGNLYDLPKVHKNNCPVRPIVAAYGPFNFNLGKHLVPLKSQLVINPYILKKSYDFASTLYTLTDAKNSFMCSLDITSLYTNIPVAETIDLILDNTYTTGVSIYKGIRRENVRKLLQLALNNTYLKFMVKFINRKNGLQWDNHPRRPLPIYS